MDVADLLSRLWMATLALTAATIVVSLLRVFWRRAFGAEQACRLWWLPPLAIVVSQLPHAAAPVVVLQVPLMPTVDTLMSHAVVATETNPIDWNAVMTLVWGVGALICLLLAAWRQWRFMRNLHDADVLPMPGGSPVVLRLTDTRGGPALVGAWHPRIVVPADFEQRYDADERRLILAHESAHARRRDGLACALATALHALFWFNPLAWWALHRFRRDQELACDAAVLETYPQARRSYAMTMLKTQTATQALPIGCPWLSGHPIKERIAMLKLSVPGRGRRRLGHAAILALVLSASAVVYAAHPARSKKLPTYHATTQAVREALVLSNGMKMAVLEFAKHHAWQLPADNAAAQLPPAGLLNGNYVKQASVRDGVITAVLRDVGFPNKAAGSVRLIPLVRAGATSQSMRWSCQSPDIPLVGQLVSGCVYAPPGTAPAPAVPARVYQLAISVKRGAKELAVPVVCVKAGQYAGIAESDANSQRAWNFNLKVDPLAGDQVQVRIDGTIGGSDGPVVTLHPQLRGALTKAMSIRVDSASGEQPITLTVIPTAGCAARKIHAGRVE